ncbi:MAG: hypothetical protein Q7V17_13840 [Afipia sp.]|nr:hypothetical protein [Afipia sp.]
MKKDPTLENSPDWDEAHGPQYNADREAKRKDIYQKHVRIQRGGIDGFKRKYEQYLRSPEWAKRREKVLERAKGICEGCRDRKATQVHHLTYDHIYEELLFELVAVCDDCHRRIHRDKQDEQSNPQDEHPDESFVNDWREGHPCEGCRFDSAQADLRWCFIFDVASADALAEGGGCGPQLASFEPLR